MQLSARYQAVAELLVEIFTDKQPADNVINAYFRGRRYIGSKDRRFIADEVWDMIRHRRRLAFEAQSEDVRKMLLVRYKEQNLDEIFDGSTYGLPSVTAEEKKWLENLPDSVYPAAVEAECPQWLFDKIGNFELVKSLNTSAEADFRINAGSRETVIKKMSDEGFDVRPTPYSPIGVRATSRINLNNCITFQDGLIEPQDEASQLAAILADVKPEHKIIDYCCGAGGKSLALSYLLQNRGVIEAHDVDARRMEALLPRMKRLQATNIKTVEQAGEDYDRFIIDAPCSGSGTWRRSPDAKYRLTEKKLADVIKVQGEILDCAVSKVKSGGRIVYITCSILAEEDSLQIERFLQKHTQFGLVDMREIWNRKVETTYPFLSGNCLTFSPLATRTDGFFIAVLQKN